MPDQSPAVEFHQVTKVFNLQAQKTFKEFLPAMLRGHQTAHRHTVLDNISFQVQKGESIGIIGPNGSGKSTILKLVAGVMSPTSGKVVVRGKVSPLIELGAGFHPELTGRENIYLNGSILGLTQSQIKEKIDSIIDFSEMAEFIDQPVKHYSSGMYMRLGFSIAVHVDPEVLIIDEILAVGDASFQQKCFEKMEIFKKQGVTILYVSHSQPSVVSFCNRAIYLNHSQIIDQGAPPQVFETYQRDIASGQ